MADTIPARLLKQVKERPHAPAYHVRENGVWKDKNWATYGEEVSRAARALMALGFEPGQTTTILGFNRPEWAILDIATLHDRHALESAQVGQQVRRGPGQGDAEFAAAVRVGEGVAEQIAEQLRQPLRIAIDQPGVARGMVGAAVAGGDLNQAQPVAQRVQALRLGVDGHRTGEARRVRQVALVKPYGHGGEP